MKSAYWRRKPPAGLIMHSDRGSQYASDSHRQLIKAYRMIQSMSRRANCWDSENEASRSGASLTLAETDPVSLR